MRRVFTPEEAEEALESVRPLAEEMVAARRELAALETRRVELLAPVAGNGGGIDPAAASALLAEMDQYARRIAGCVAGIHELGALVKDLDRGLVDFPARGRSGDVLLCWRVGEAEIGYWHGPEEGFGGRKPLPLD